MFNPKTDILALDFDGVVNDSIVECLLVSYNALMIQQGDPNRISQINELNSGIVQGARRIRKFIRHGQDYVYIHLALQQGARINNQADFDRFIDEYESLNVDFRRLFYRERARFWQENPRQWLALNPCYSGMRKFLENFQPKERLYIITTKLKVNIQAVIGAANIDLVSENILSADQKLSKPEIIRRLLFDNRMEATAFHFVDDQVDTLIQAKNTGVNLFLAGWGYNNTEQADLARNNGLNVFSLKKFYRLFGGFATPESNK